MVTHRVKAAVKSGLVFGIICGLMWAGAYLSSAASALGALAFLGQFGWPAIVVLGFASGVLGMFWGGGYVRTLENSVVQGGIAGATTGIIAFALAAACAAVFLAVSGGDISLSLTIWVTGGSEEAMRRVGTAFISGMVGGIAAAPLIIRIR